eukprot:8904119-Ditylum_brightwellii.AAC.1
MRAPLPPKDSTRFQDSTKKIGFTSYHPLHDQYFVGCGIAVSTRGGLLSAQLRPPIAGIEG